MPVARVSLFAAWLSLALLSVSPVWASALQGAAPAAPASRSRPPVVMGPPIPADILRKLDPPPVNHRLPLLAGLSPTASIPGAPILVFAATPGRAAAARAALPPGPSWAELEAALPAKPVFLPTQCADAGVGSLAVRSGMGPGIRLWLSGPKGSSEVPRLLRIQGLAAQGWRVQVSGSGMEAMGPRADVNLQKRETLELPLLLSSERITRVDLTPEPLSPFEIALSAPQFLAYAGEPIPLAMTVRNVSDRPQSLTWRLTGSVKGLAPDTDPSEPEMVPPGGVRGLRFPLVAPLLARDSPATIQVQEGDDCFAFLALRIGAPLTAVLENPASDLAAGERTAAARVRMANRSQAPLVVWLKTNGKNVDPKEPVTIPGRASAVGVMELEPPSRDPGEYPIDIRIEGVDTTLATLQARVGIPVLCRYASVRPAIDADLTPWADAEPMGMGRAEQMHGEKPWKGPLDLSAVAYAKWDEQALYFACAVTDDVFSEPFESAQMTRGDSVILGITTDREGRSRAHPAPYGYLFGLALVKGLTPTLYRLPGEGGPAGPVRGARIAVRRVGVRTIYEAAIPWLQLGVKAPRSGSLLGISVVVSDNDGTSRGYAEWGGGIEPVVRPGWFPPLRLVR